MAKILVIEDQEIIRENLVEILEHEGFEVLEAENGQKGLQLAKINIPDLILCDVLMPDLTGYEVIESIRQNPETSTIRFIFLTAKADKMDVRQGMVLGADDYLTKPFTCNELLDAIASQLKKQEAIAQKHRLDLQQLEERFNQFLCYDLITGLPNQFLLREQFEQLLKESSHPETQIAIFSLYCHHFERLTTALDPTQYDYFQQLFVKRLRQRISSHYKIVRFQENQFIIMVSEVSNQEESAQIAQDILNALVLPFEVKEQRIYLSASIGICAYPQDGRQIETLTRYAQIAAQSISHPQSYEFYTPDLRLRSLEQFILENELRTAWEHNYFQVYYQPQINPKTQQIIGAEALIRCILPQQKFLSPTQFIPLAEETGLIIPLGEWVAHTACQQAKSWQNQGNDQFKIAVNLSSRQLNQPGLEQVINRVLAETGISPTCLELEITESCVMENPETAIATLKNLRNQGIQIALDDFGTGYSSLSYLKKIPLNTVKIDRSFIRNIQDDPQNREIVKNIIQMAHSLGLKVVAEGVETQAECDYLSKHQCDELQGYLFSRPIPAQEFYQLLENWNKVAC